MKRIIYCTSIKVSPDANKNKKNQKQSIGRSKGGLTTKLRLCCTSSCPVAFRLSPGNSHDAPEGRNPYIPKIIIIS